MKQRHIQIIIIAPMNGDFYKPTEAAEALKRWKRIEKQVGWMQNVSNRAGGNKN